MTWLHWQLSISDFLIKCLVNQGRYLLENSPLIQKHLIPKLILLHLPFPAHFHLQYINCFIKWEFIFRFIIFLLLYHLGWSFYLDHWIISKEDDLSIQVYQWEDFLTFSLFSIIIPLTHLLIFYRSISFNLHQQPQCLLHHLNLREH